MVNQGDRTGNGCFIRQIRQIDDIALAVLERGTDSQNVYQIHIGLDAIGEAAEAIELQAAAIRNLKHRSGGEGERTVDVHIVISPGNNQVAAEGCAAVDFDSFVFRRNDNAMEVAVNGITPAGSNHGAAAGGRAELCISITVSPAQRGIGIDAAAVNIQGNIITGVNTADAHAIVAAGGEAAGAAALDIDAQGLSVCDLHSAAYIEAASIRQDQAGALGDGNTAADGHIALRHIPAAGEFGGARGDGLADLLRFCMTCIQIGYLHRAALADAVCVKDVGVLFFQSGGNAVEHHGDLQLCRILGQDIALGQSGLEDILTLVGTGGGIIVALPLPQGQRHHFPIHGGVERSGQHL